MQNGEFLIEVDLVGGSGRASITSPCELFIENENATAQIEWSSPNYDYMIVSDEKYTPVNTEGNSVFEIPVESFDTPIIVIADTTAMSVPHEIEYTLTFHQDTMQKVSDSTAPTSLFVGLGLVIVLGIVGALSLKKKKQV